VEPFRFTLSLSLTLGSLTLARLASWRFLCWGTARKRLPRPDGGPSRTDRRVFRVDRRPCTLRKVVHELGRDVQRLDRRRLTLQKVAIESFGSPIGSIGTSRGSIESLSASIELITGSIESITGSFESITGSIESITGSFGSLPGPFGSLPGSMKGSERRNRVRSTPIRGRSATRRPPLRPKRPAVPLGADAREPCASGAWPPPRRNRCRSARRGTRAARGAGARTRCWS
jgi:hypothetical protein